MGDGPAGRNMDYWRSGPAKTWKSGVYIPPTQEMRIREKFTSGASSLQMLGIR